MHLDEAVALIRPAVTGYEGTWADLGAGSGLFTRALLELLGPDGHVFAIDSSTTAVAELERLASSRVTVMRADLRDDLAFPAPLDGILLANTLHFVRSPGPVLAGVARQVRAGGRVVLVEYDRRSANRWVPYPIAISELPKLAEAAGLSQFRVVESRPSDYEGIIYAAAATRSA